MNVSSLRAIIKNVEDTVTCPSCSASYTDSELTVVSAIDQRCILVAQCRSCPTAILITAAVQQVSRPATDAERAASGESVTVDDVVSVHEILKDFTGDISSLVGKLPPL